MTKITFTLLVSSLLVISACCTKKECINMQPYIKFYGYTADELDTVYQSINGGAHELAHINESGDGSYTYELYLPNEKFQGNVKLSIPGAGKEIVVSDFTYVKRSCNQCFPAGHDKYDYMKGFTVNGQQYNSSAVELYKE